MELNHIVGYAGAVLTGLILGLMGGGGALLSIPVLHYLFLIPADVATGYSLFLIGVTATSGAIQNIREKLVDYNALAYYGIPSAVTVYCVRRFLIPNLPDTIIHIYGYTLDKNHTILGLLCIVMFTLAYKMILVEPEIEQEHEVKESEIGKLIMYSVLIGLFIGVVGAGGGFLMTPALIYIAHLSIKKAIGTSLLLVAGNSLIGFMGDIHSNQTMDWKFLFIFSSFSIVGVFVGIYLQQFIQAKKLKKMFGWFVLFIAVLMVLKETLT